MESSVVLSLQSSFMRGSRGMVVPSNGTQCRVIHAIISFWLGNTLTILQHTEYDKYCMIVAAQVLVD